MKPTTLSLAWRSGCLDLRVAVGQGKAIARDAIRAMALSFPGASKVLWCQTSASPMPSRLLRDQRRTGRQSRSSGITCSRSSKVHELVAVVGPASGR